MMTIKQVRQALKDMVRDLNLADATVYAEQPGRWLHIWIVTRDFEGKSAGQRENVIWSEFERRFDDDTILAITQCYLLTPEEQSATVAPRK
ncbi:MAG: hypothetical protein NTW86_04510 [Candidatus Sumerlaeota bacterium]|nr:hypothetical protein [Candidatus Sumerlaeota bacterium]